MVRVLPWGGLRPAVVGDRGPVGRLGGVVGPQCNESQIVELPDSSLLFNMRSYAGKNRRAIAASTDGGLTFCQPTLDQALIEPVCQASLIRYAAGDPLLLFSNPANTKRE